MSPSDKPARHPRIFAIIPAAGRSERMGRPKQLLAVGGRPMLASVADSLRAAGVMFVAVVTRSEVAEAIDHSLPSATLVVLNDDPATEMIHSIRMGLDAWAGRVRVLPHDGILIVPGDQPGIPPHCIQACVARFIGNPGSVVVAAWQGRTGHPLIFPATLADFVRSPRCDGGLRALPLAHADRVCRVECDSPAVVRNVNTPADYNPLG